VRTAERGNPVLLRPTLYRRARLVCRRSGRDGAHLARSASAMHRRSRVHSLAESVPVLRGRSLYTALCRADGPFDRRLKTKFGSDMGKFLRVHVAPIQGEKAESSEASFAEMDLWHASLDLELD
jgi:hypothetical protein